MSIRNGLLALLAAEPKYGYQLKTEFEAATGGMWPLNVGQIYTTLERLVRDGSVAVDETDDQKQYHLTPDGRDELGAWWRTLPAEDPPPRDELMVKVLLAIATGTTDDALGVITEQRTAVTELLQRRRRTQRAVRAGGATVAERLADDALVVRAEADLRWLDLCESRLLDNHPVAPSAGGGSPATESDLTDRADPPKTRRSTGRTPKPRRR